MPQRAVLDGAGNLVLTYADGAGPHPDREGREPMRRGQVWKYAIATGMWTEHHAGRRDHPFAGVSVDPADPQRLVVSTINTFVAQGDAKGDRIYISRDGGAHWTDVIGRGFAKDAAGVPWLKGHGIHWTGSVEFDTRDSRAVWVTSGNGVFRTANIDAAPATWTFTVAGMEETVPLGLVSIPGGPLVSAIGDIDGYLHDDPSATGASTIRRWAPPPASMSRPRPAHHGAGGRQHVPDATTAAPLAQDRDIKGRRGQLALSADGAVILHIPSARPRSGARSTAAPAGPKVKGLARAGLRPAADPLDARVFYAYEADTGALLASTDGGASFAPRATLAAGGAPLIRLAPGRSQDLWVALKDGGLARSATAARRFAMLAGVSYCGAVGFGKAGAGKDYPTVYIWGTVGAKRGLYRSTDAGAHWLRINDDAHQYGGPGDGQFVVGDMNRYGVVYMSTAGRGIVYGNPAAETP
jgi:hypothetical protein